MIQGSDIQYVLSGGPANNDPNLSLGGDPSSVGISDGINNLFDDVSDEESQAGATDYRCFYIFNNNVTDSFYGTKLWIESEVAEGSDINVGIPLKDDIQKITITGNVTSGNLQLVYDTTSFSFNFDSDVTTD